MGLLDSIGTVLGGFNDVKQIDQQGFDFREKRRQEELARQQQQEQWRQANADFQRQQEEADIAGLAEASLAPDATPESIGAGIKPGVEAARRKFLLDRAAGRSAQSKSALAGQEANTKWMLRQMGGEQRLNEIGARGDQAEELARIKADIEAGRKPSPRDLAMLASAEKRAGTIGTGGGRPQLRQVKDENGNTVWRWLSPGEGAPAPATAVERQAAGAEQLELRGPGQPARIGQTRGAANRASGLAGVLRMTSDEASDPSPHDATLAGPRVPFAWQPLTPRGGAVKRASARWYSQFPENGRRAIDGMMLRAPVLGLILRKIAVARFCRTLSTLISSGVPILDGLEHLHLLLEGLQHERVAEGKAGMARHRLGDCRPRPRSESAASRPDRTDSPRPGQRRGLSGVLVPDGIALARAVRDRRS